MKKLILFSFFLAFFFGTKAQENYRPSPENMEARSDFQDRKFGLFIHWGIYSLLGNGEWVMHNKEIPYENYARLASAFYPWEFDAKEWVTMAKNAGMKYITITSRHHDGFSLFDTRASDYNIVKATPWKKDPIKELAEECHRQGIKLFFYYSLLDWGRQDYGFGQKIINGKPEKADWDHYIQFMKQQLTELLTNYGPIGGIWFDGEWERKEANWHFDEIYGLIHQLQPSALIVNNHHHFPRPGEDVQEFEKDLPGADSHGWNEGGVTDQLPLESCETMNNSWGFNIYDRDYKSVKEIIHYLVRDAGANSNLLLNVGPMANGLIQPEFKDTLSAVGEWLHRYGPTIYGSRAGFISPQDWGATTRKDGKQYLHLLKIPKNKTLFLPGVTEKIQSAQYFDSAKKVRYKQIPEGTFLYLQDAEENKIDLIIEVTLNKKGTNIPSKDQWKMNKS